MQHQVSKQKMHTQFINKSSILFPFYVTCFSESDILINSKFLMLMCQNAASYIFIQLVVYFWKQSDDKDAMPWRIDGKRVLKFKLLQCAY